MRLDEVAQVVSDSLRPCGLQPTRVLRPWDSPVKNTGVGCHFLLQGIFPTQRLNPGIKPRSSSLEADPLTSEPPGKHQVFIKANQIFHLYHFLGQIDTSFSISASISENTIRLFVLCAKADQNLKPLNSTSEKGMATHSSILAWKNRMERAAWQAAVHGVARSPTRLSDFTFMYWWRKWQLTPVFLPGESQGWRSLVGCHLWGLQESDTTEVTQQKQQQQQYLDYSDTVDILFLVW